jgi:hypothetical protein
MDSIAFLAANRLSFSCSFGEGGTPLYHVTHSESIGVIPPGRIYGDGATLDEALASYMGALLDQRAAQKDYLTPYADEATADPVVAQAITDDARMPAPVEKELTASPVME